MAETKTLTGEGDLYEGETKLRRVLFEIRYRRVTVAELEKGDKEWTRGQFTDLGGAVEFFDLAGPGRVFTLKFGAGGSWPCLVDMDGEATSAGDLVLPPA
jgi:hypothetical protein